MGEERREEIRQKISVIPQDDGSDEIIVRSRVIFVTNGPMGWPHVDHDLEIGRLGGGNPDVSHFSDDADGLKVAISNCGALMKVIDDHRMALADAADRLAKARRLNMKVMKDGGWAEQGPIPHEAE